MQFKLSSIIILLLALAFTRPAFALTKMGELSEYYKDYADVKQGATITTPSKIHPESKLETIITPKYDGTFIFADGVEQREEFTIDLGQERKLGMFIFEMTLSTVYGGEVNRKPGMLRVEISTQSANGPWTEVYKLDPAEVNESFALDNVPARWVHFDLGMNTDGVGSRIRKAKIYKRYKLTPAPELMKEFCTQFKRDVPGLAEFWKAADAQKWEEACDLLIGHFSKWPPEPKGQASPRVALWMRNEVEGDFKFENADWDWFRIKAEHSHPTLGGLPGASSILQVLSSSYAATRDEAYAKQLAALLRDWLQDLPCPGVHRGQDGVIVNGWAGIVASQRTWSFGTIVHKIFPDNKNFDRDLKINVLYSLWEHINFMRQVFPELGGNWLTNANSCMFEGAVHYPEFVQYKDWLDGSKSFFETSLTRDFYASGRAFEDSTMYVPIATNQVTGQYAAMHKAGITINTEAQQRMERLWDCETWVHYPDQSVPAIGDAHRESPLAKPADTVPDSYLECFDRPDLVYINTQGKKGKMPRQTSRAFSDCGWYVMRSDWTTKPYLDARQMFFKASKCRWHSHPDQLSMTMYAYGREILTDPGNTSYGVPDEAKVRPTSVHNTICVDGKDQGEAPGTENLWFSSKGMDFVDAECEGNKGILHRRQIVFLKSGTGLPDYWLVRDSVKAEGEHNYDLNFHFSEGANPIIRDGSVCTTYASGGNALLRCIDQSAKPEFVDAVIVSDKLVPSKIARFTKKQVVPVQFGTLIMPYNGPTAPTVETQYLKLDPECASADATCVRIDGKSGTDFVVISTKPGTALSFDNGRIKTDSAALVIRTDKKGRVIQAFANSGAATYNGKPIAAKRMMGA